jgi:hypothetical protein
VRTPQAVAAAREDRLSSRRMLARCRWTVCSLKTSRRAISGLLSPRRASARRAREASAPSRPHPMRPPAPARSLHPCGRARRVLLRRGCGPRRVRPRRPRCPSRHAGAGGRGRPDGLPAERAGQPAAGHPPRDPRQIHALTTRRDLDAGEVCWQLTSRWREENYFRYAPVIYESRSRFGCAWFGVPSRAATAGHSWLRDPLELRDPAELRLAMVTVGCHQCIGSSSRSRCECAACGWGLG